MRRALRLAGGSRLRNLGPTVLVIVLACVAVLTVVLLDADQRRARASADLAEVSASAADLAVVSGEDAGATKATYVARIAALRADLVRNTAATTLIAPQLSPGGAKRLVAAVAGLLAATDRVARVRTTQGDPEASAVFDTTVRPALTELDLAVAGVERELLGEAERDERSGIGIGCVAVAGAGVIALLTYRRLRRLTGEASDRAKFEALVSGAADVILLTDAQGEVSYASPATTSALGITPGRWPGRRLADQVVAQDVELVESLMKRALAEPGMAHGGRVVARHLDGHRVHLDLLVHRLLVTLEPAARNCLVWTVRDVTGAQVMEQRLRQIAFYDRLTSLPNRLLFTDRVDETLAAARANGAQRPAVAVAMLDLDRFREVLDALGAAAGDLVLVEVARRLRGCVPEERNLGRIGPDTFVMVHEGRADPAQALLAGRALLDAVRPPMTIDGDERQVTASVGVALADTVCDAETLLRRARTALHAAKTAGGAAVLLFEDSMRARAAERLEIVSHLSRAAAQGELELLYQPVVDLATGYVGGVEALLRWRHPRLGRLGPDAFIGLAEETDLIGEIGGWALAEACRQAVDWRGRLGARAPGSVAVNLSARQLRSPSIVEEVAAALSRTGMNPAGLTLEITESSLVEDLDGARRHLGELRRLGVRVAIDDFGVGYSSLSYLQDFPVDVLKIDRSFLRASDATMLAGICSLAASLRLRIIGEGVETAEQARLMLDVGCDAAQGFLFAAPGWPAEIEPLLGVNLDVVPGKTIRLRQPAADEPKKALS